MVVDDVVVIVVEDVVVMVVSVALVVEEVVLTVWLVVLDGLVEAEELVVVEVVEAAIEVDVEEVAFTSDRAKDPLPAMVIT
jgi:hypothetical protein